MRPTSSAVVILTLTMFATACADDAGVDPGGPDVGIDSSDARTRVDGADDAADDAGETFVFRSDVGAVPEYPQREGDPDAGYHAIVNEGYVSCGIPWSLYSQFFGEDAPEYAKIPGRTGRNANLPYNFTALEKNGVELVSTNCLACHAKQLGGEIYVGLGNEGDFTTTLASSARLGRGFLETDAEREEFDRWLERYETVEPYVTTNTRGVNTADNLTGVIFAHRDPYTWEWSEEPHFDVPAVDPIPLSVPPLWNVKKKNALYYTALGRGDHARMMMAASTLCTDSVEEAREIDSYFVDIRAYIETIEPPPYPYEIDQAKAGEGETVFENTCSRCHGTYGEDPTYPNLVVSLEEVGTDPTLATAGALAAGDVIAWFNESFFGEVSTAAPAMGYIAPPLDGIWATAPYFHNASVPTVEGVLDSAKRPRYWTRDFSNPQYDSEALGLVHSPLAYGKDGAADAEAALDLFDTTLTGYSNEGHTFGDDLSESERGAVIEYLKTL